MLNELQDGIVQRCEPEKDKPVIEMKGNFSWGFVGKQDDLDSDEEGENVEVKKETENTEIDEDNFSKVESKLVLKNLDLKIKKGEFVCIIGEVGSGKTSLLNSIIGDMIYVSDDMVKKIGGIDARISHEKCASIQNELLYNKDKQEPAIKTRGSISYVEQSYWIQNMTIRDNILFGLPLNEERYVRTILSCCLERDLEIFPMGDMTEIGERGVNLSGGQKARISLARAVYADRDIILMDDPISALDANVRKKIFKRVFCDMLQGKTRVLCTHAIDFLHLADKIIVVKKGEIAI